MHVLSTIFTLYTLPCIPECKYLFIIFKWPPSHSNDEISVLNMWKWAFIIKLTFDHAEPSVCILLHIRTNVECRASCKMKVGELGFEAKMGPYLGKCNLFALHLQIANKQKDARGTKNVDKFIWHKNGAGTSILFSIISPYLFYNEFTSWSKHWKSFFPHCDSSEPWSKYF